MEKCNLLYDTRCIPYRAISFLEKNNYEIEIKEETDTIFVLESVYGYPCLMAWRIGKARGENKKLVLLVENKGGVYVESWLMESVCVAFNIKTGEEVEMIEL